MTKEELLLLRKKYADSIKEKEELIKIGNRILELKEMPEVREYFRLIELFEQKNKSEDKVNKSELYFLERATMSIKITPTTDIYVYMGTYKYTDDYDYERSCPDILVSRYSKEADYVVYKNIESNPYDFNITMPISKAEEFEKNNHIIFPENIRSYDSYFRKLQLNYFDIAINDSLEAAKKYILKKVKKSSSDDESFSFEKLKCLCRQFYVDEKGIVRRKKREY